ncbi:amidase domain-containing protein [Agromyces mariniharenae]|uniref:CHAP domain-containing protein n=1 Tax=Agromyces mariniharenae TaxID=2604423 RepID=A0A5S4V2H8_9MICO|nr:amidase domain-containing protein [Agromyces mariniharenae]TYL53334.1 CHAP domain-containing protein [Agromyces mariniharenae]
MPKTPDTPELPVRFRTTFRVPSSPYDVTAAAVDPTETVTGELGADWQPGAASEFDAIPAPEEPAIESDEAGAVFAALDASESDATEPTTALEPEASDEPEPTATPQPRPKGPRHRAERVRNRRAPGAAFRRTVALGCASAIMGVTALGAVAAAANDGTSVGTVVSANAVDRATPTDTIAAEPASEVDEGPAVTGELSVTSAPFTGGTQVTVTGEELDQVAAVSVGDAAATIVSADEGQVTFAVPAVADTATGSIAEVHFADAAGQPIDVEMPTAVVAAGTSVVQPLEGELTGRPEAAVPTTPRTLTLTYTSDPGIDAQVAYVLTYWSSYNSAQYPVIDGYDCANFASQSLIARGWAMDGGWYLDGGTGAMSPSWASSTALRDYLRTRTDRAIELDDSQRSQVKVGDIAQFDWDGSGDRDHTAVVTRVEHSDAGTKVWVGGHTKDADFWDVDTALATGGGSVSYFSIR